MLALSEVRNSDTLKIRIHSAQTRNATKPNTKIVSSSVTTAAPPTSQRSALEHPQPAEPHGQELRPDDDDRRRLDEDQRGEGQHPEHHGRESIGHNRLGGMQVAVRADAEAGAGHRDGRDACHRRRAREATRPALGAVQPRPDDAQEEEEEHEPETGEVHAGLQRVLVVLDEADDLLVGSPTPSAASRR